MSLPLGHSGATRVGAVVIVCALVGGVTLVWRGNQPWWARTRVSVALADAGALREGADVQMAGRVVGRVDRIRVDKRVPASVAETGPAPIVVASLWLDAAAIPVEPEEIFIHAKGLFGEAYLEMVPSARAGRIQDGTWFRGVDPPRLEDLLVRSYLNLVETRRFAAALAPAWDELVSSYRDVRRELAQLGAVEGVGVDTAFLDQLRAVIDKGRRACGASCGVRGGVPPRLATAVDRLRPDLTDAASEFRRLRAHRPERVAGGFRALGVRVEALLTKWQALERSAEEILRSIQRGEGSVGAILHDPEFFDMAKQMARELIRNPWRVVGHPPR